MKYTKQEQIENRNRWVKAIFKDRSIPHTEEQKKKRERNRQNKLSKMSPVYEIKIANNK